MYIYFIQYIHNISAAFTLRCVIYPVVSGFFSLYHVPFISGNNNGIPNPCYTCDDYRVFKSHVIFRNAISRFVRA